MAQHDTGRRRTVAASLIGAVLAWFSSAGAARAQLLDQFVSPYVYGLANEENVTVLSRSRPDFEAPGVRAGSFVIRPQLTESGGYESNVLGSTRPVGSALIETNAALSAASDWSRNSLRAEMTVDNVSYLSQGNQSYTNWTATLAGTYEVGRDLLSAQYQHLNFNQTTRDLDVPQLTQPLSFTVDTVLASYRINLNRLSVTPGIDVSNYTYSNGNAAGGTYLQSYRDRVVVTPSVTVGYEFQPRRSAIVVLRDGIASYTNNQAGLPRRDYNDPSILGGIDYDVTGLFRVRLLAGFEARLFNSAAYRTITAPVIEASAIWTPTGLTTVTGTISRHIQDTADDTTAAFTQTSILLAVDHEYLRNVLLRGTAGVFFGQYAQGGGDQTLYTAGASATYLVNRNIRATLSYDFQARTSSNNGTAVLGPNNQVFGSSYTDHKVLLQLRLNL